MATQRAGSRSADRLADVVTLIAVIAILAVVAGGIVALVSLQGPPPAGQGSVAGGAAASPSAGGSSTAGGASTAGAGASGSPAAADFLLATPRIAPPIVLTDPTGQPFSLASLRGRQVLVFFGYTHCADVCPATIGTLGQVLNQVGPSARAVFVSIDPQRDTVAWLKEYAQWLPAGITPLTGSADDIRTTADAWGVRYARVDTGDPANYSMSHTADVWLVDAKGSIRADFPFGTDAGPIAQVVTAITAQTAAGAAPTAGATASPTAAPTASPGLAALRPEVLSTSVWAQSRSGDGASTPVILSLSDQAGRIDDPALAVTASLVDAAGTAVGGPVTATAVQPPGEKRVLYVANVVIPSAGPWRLDVSATGGGQDRRGSVTLNALDPGTTAPIGAAAPTAHTPTLDDVGGDIHAVTTDPNPDPRLSTTSTTDALAAHQPFVLVIDSPKFRVSPACGKAVIMARYLADRWRDVAFIHLEPYVYTVESTTPVLSGDLTNPPVRDVAAAWGFTGDPWGARSMPWLFVVDGNGIVRAKYQGLMGSDDADVILSMLEAAGGH